jgi:WD40 repeat protein/serine/threonine protein kinase
MPRAGDRIESILAAAVEIASEAERREFVDRACAEDAGLKARVEELIANHFRAGSFLECSASDLVVTVEAAKRERPGTVIGPYKLLEQIGEGGMGIVFMAEQTQPVRRKVALKVIKPGMDTRQVIARFEAERQALALMDHPNIARVLDGGETAGRPYFVMELVRGIPITDFCDQNHFSVRQRLELFVSVCQAVHHAHQKGVIHRDLKPSNVLVTLHDGVPVVKVIDFGIAKATGTPLTDKTLFTGFAQMIGTPLYMSPEQAQLSGLDIDTRADIYALGVLLYELLTGTTPFDAERLRTVGYDEIRRIIREEEPARPSNRISTLGQAAATVSTNRRSDPRKLSELFRGELDWIVMKALEKDRSRRYESASAFAADVQRYLKDEPVLACPPSGWYRFRKFARRNKAALAGAALLGVGALALLALAGVGVVFSYYQGAQSALQSEASARKAEADAGEEKELFHYYHRVTLAHQAWRDNQVGQADQLLDQCPARFRQWEWYYLKRLCNPELLSLEARGGATSVAFSPDGKTFASGGADHKVEIRDVATGRTHLVLTGHVGPLRKVAYSPDSKLLASLGTGATSATCELKVWDVRTGKETASFRGDIPLTESVAFSPDGLRLATCDDPRTETPWLRIWDTTTGKETYSWRSHSVGANGVAFSPDGKYLATAGGDHRIQLWDAGTYQHIRALRGYRHRPFAVSFSPDGKQLASAGKDGTVKTWDPATGREVHSLAGHTREAVAVAFSPDGTRLVSAGGDDTVRLWDLTTGEELGIYRGHRAAISGVAFSPHGQRLVSSDWDGRVLVWDATRNPEALVLKGPNREIVAAAFGLAGSDLVTAGADGVLRFWDLAGGREVRSVPVPAASWRVPYMGVAFSDGGRRLASPAEGKAAAVWDGATGRRLLTLRGHGKGVFSTALSADGSRVASASYDTTVKVWDVASGQELLTLHGHTDAVHWAAFSPDGTRLASGCLDATVKLWDLATNQELATCRGHTGRISCLRFSPDGKFLASGGDDGRALLWDGATGQERFSLTHGRTGEIVGLAFSPDSRRLASRSLDGSLKLWDPSNGQNTLSLSGPMYGPLQGRIQVLTFSPDGRRLISDELFGKVRVWDATPGSEGQRVEPWKEIPAADPPKPVPTREESARRLIERARQDVEMQPESATSCNSLAWAYLTAPEPLRDTKAALPLAEKAVRLSPESTTYRNTLGVAYYRAGRYREAVEVFRQNLASQDDLILAYDLYFLAMSHHRLGEAARARDYYDWAFRWTAAQRRLSAERRDELSFFRVEAEELLGIDRQKD